MIRPLIEYLPDFMRDFREMKALFNTAQTQSTLFWDADAEAWDNNFVTTLDEAGCDRWEHMLKLSNKDTYTLKDRRNKIAGKLAEQRPFTVKSLQRMLESLCGADGYFLTVDPASFFVEVKVTLGSKNAINDVGDLLGRVIPANMTWDVSLLYNTWEVVSNHTWEEISAYTWDEVLSSESLLD